MFDTHIHSTFSSDSRIEPEKACEKAISLGLDGLAITDHLDCGLPWPEDLRLDFDQYSKAIDILKSKYAGRLKVLKGIEVGIQPSVLKECGMVVKSYDFDYVIGSIHIIDGVDPYLNNYYNDKSPREAYGRYLELILFMIDNFDDFDVLGHMEYITRYSPYDDRMLRYDDNADLIDEILKKLIEKGKGLEVNTASFRERNGKKAIDIDRKILKKYKELGGQLICLASDAHLEEHIGYKFKYYGELLIDEGFKYIVHFEKRKPVFDKL